VDKIVMDRNHPLTNELIGMLENGEVRGRKTENYMFILSGAFQQIFNDQKKSGQASPKITREDLEKYGVRDELLGRIPLIANLTPPTLETMTQVLDGPDSVLTKYANYFSTKGYALELEPGVAEIICRKALEFNKGFRALPTVCRKLFGEYMIHLARYVQPEGDKLLVKLEDAHNILEVPKYDPPREPLKFPGTGYN
jgi:hypothetical protein